MIKNNEIADTYRSFIHKSRYARWRDDLSRRESWAETVDRYISFFQRRDNSKVISPELWESLRYAIFMHQVMPSMRALMTAGPALERDNVAGYNPVTGDTRVVVEQLGNIPIKYLSGETHNILNVNGDWTEGTFRSYGVQDVYKVTTKLNSNTIKEVCCTANHRWLLLDGSVKATKDLVAGDKLPFAAAPKPQQDADYILGVRHGIIYGDGTASKAAKRVKGYVVRLCGDSAELLKYFEGYPVTYPPSANGDPIVQMYDDFASTHSLKELPSNAETDSYLLGFIRGWLAADGSVTKSSQVSLCVSGVGKEWLQTFSERLGFVIQRVYKQSSETNYGKRNKDSFVVYFSRSSMIEDDFLCSWKASNFKPLVSQYVVSDVVNTQMKEEVFCAEVPDTNTFTLEGGLVTGNCSFLAINRVRAFDELMYILLCGTGVGFSCERQEISNLPPISESLHESDTVIVVSDSKIGWASAFRELISLLYAGKIPKWDLSKVRPEGSQLKIFGGRASGPRPLDSLFNYTASIFKNAAGRKLNSIEVHGLVCKIAEVVVVGGVRRSALISLSNLSDDRMRHAKSGQWWVDHPEFALANNSVCYTEKPDAETFMREWLALIESKSGERGIFNREAAQKHASSNGRRDASYQFGTNPCAEISLRDKGFCNLTEVVIREGDSLEDIKNKVTLAVILGTLQATLTDFRYLSKKWRQNTEEEALLGVSMTGIMDHPFFAGSASHLADKGGQLLSLPEALRMLRSHAISVNKEYSDLLGINQSVAVTTCKPSGTVSQLVDSASGIHPRYSPFYIRTVRADRKDPLAKFMIQEGFPYELDVMKPDTTVVFSFPMKAPEGAIFRDERSALEQLKHWLIYKENWAEHSVSVTIYVRDSEWLDVGAFVYAHFDEITGVSFLPHSNHTYQQAPYQEVTEELYEKALMEMPQAINWANLATFESTDMTEGSQHMSCTGSSCEIVDLT